MTDILSRDTFKAGLVAQGVVTVLAPVSDTDAVHKQYVDDRTPIIAPAVPVGSYLASTFLVGASAVSGAYGTTTALSVTRGLAYPYILQSPQTFNAWWSDVRNAAADNGATQLAALYSTDPVTGWPKTLIQDLGSRTITATGALDVAFSSVTLQSGTYWVCSRHKSTTTTKANPQWLGNALAGAFYPSMSTGTVSNALAVDLVAMGANWATDITSYLLFNYTSLTTVPRIGLKRSA